ncbi:MAG: hypothetical protein ABIR30_13640 [Chitinophagaceae bacterium]
MRYIIDITPKQARSIQKYFDKGNYGSISQFISTAIENQLSLEENEISDLMPYTSDKKSQATNIDNIMYEQDNFERLALKNIPAFNTVVNPPEFKDLVYASQKIQENEAWIWGQVNKIFPVKVGVRILHQILATRQSIELNEFLEMVSTEAATMGDQIRVYEKRNNKMRGEKISAALPSSDEKSRNRYKFQFMVYLRKDGLMDGAMSLMKFCNIYEEKKKKMIGLTEPGLRFSLIANSVLDNDDLDNSLNEEESLYYLAHIKENVKGEYGAIQWMLEKISSGKNERVLLNTEIETTFGRIWGVTNAVINTQRAGITARMFELGLIKKEKDGIYVKYGVSEFGRKTLGYKN